MDKKVVGIITFHTANNFGAVLQAYAMQYVCTGLGYDVRMIRYKGFDAANGTHPFRSFLGRSKTLKSIRRLARSLAEYPWRRKKEKAFQEFKNKYFIETPLCDSAEKIVSLGFNAYIAGSDQIWNYHITGGRLDPVYFLNINTNVPKIVYAASSQDVPFPEDWEKRLRESLTAADASVGIRDKALTEYADRLTGKEYTMVLDPTLLAGKEFLDTIAVKKPAVGPYILIYQIDHNPDAGVSVKTLEKQFNKAVYTLTVPCLGDMHGRRGDIGIEAFLGYIKYADMIVTNSYHGLCVSLLYHKLFYVYENKGSGQRVGSLLGLLGLQEQSINNINEIEPDRKLDYGHIDKLLIRERKKSMRFLEEGLKNDYNGVSSQGTENAYLEWR